MTNYSIKNGILLGDGVVQLISPNKDDRPGGDFGDISLLVIHCISLPKGKYTVGSINDGYIAKLFTNKLLTEDISNINKTKSYDDDFDYTFLNGLKVSSHLCIYRDGTIVQFVSFLERAWHAGESEYEGRPKCNDYSIGVELEGDESFYTDSQYRALSNVTTLLIKEYPKITKKRITAHSTIAPRRKTDPGLGFDWERYKSEVF